MPAVVNTILPGLQADILFGTGKQHKVTGKGTDEIINTQLKLTEGQILAIQIQLKLCKIYQQSNRYPSFVLSLIVVSGHNAKTYSELSFTHLRK